MVWAVPEWGHLRLPRPRSASSHVLCPTHLVTRLPEYLADEAIMQQIEWLASRTDLRAEPCLTLCRADSLTSAFYPDRDLGFMAPYQTCKSSAAMSPV